MPAPPEPAPSRTPPSPSAQPLFRQEVMEEQQSQWLGTVLLAPRLSHLAFTAFAALAGVGILSLLFFGEYTRKSRVAGWLVPELGLIRIFAPQPGILARVHVREGAEVKKGDPLVLISAEVQSAALGETRREIVRRLAERRDSFAAERDRQRRLTDQQAREMTRRLASLQEQEASLARETVLQRERLKLSESIAARQKQLRDKALTTSARYEQAEADRLDQEVRLQGLERSRIAAEQERLKLAAELRELPLRAQTQAGEIERSTAALDQEVAETESRREILITAPQDGTVTAIQAEPGGGVNPAVPLLSIVPAGSRLQAQIFSPSRAIGFVRPEQRVLLRYEAFPFQKFGYYEGTVASVSRSAVTPAELPQQLAGLTSLYGVAEPVYRITVDLARQTATAYGEPVRLQPGMKLDADILIERRRLIEWMFDPLFTLTGTWRQ